MESNYTIWKEWGETPLVALERLRAEKNIPATVPMTYAGRLDPAAEGQLIVLVGDECKKKDAYMALSKTYEAVILFGISTDSYDLLGMPEMHSDAVIHEGVEKFLMAQIGKKLQKYPAYSSKTVDGKQLHAHAKAGTEVALPTHEVELYEYSELKVGQRSREEIIERVMKLSGVVKGDFRQGDIRVAWNDIAQKMPPSLSVISVTLKVSSGFYIRQLAEDIGWALGTGACLYSLVRTDIEKLV